MRVLFVSGAGVTPDQRIERWRMVTSLYAQFGQALRSLGHQTYYYVHPEAHVDELPPELAWLHPDHEHFDHVLDRFRPDFVFCWNGSSPGDRVTATMAAASGARMMYSEQGWFPQSRTLYFDMTGTNARCGTRHKLFADLTDKQRSRFISLRRGYIEGCGIAQIFDPEAFVLSPPDLARPIFVPLQDERDLNIVQDAPFKTMDAFVTFLVTTWPNLKFRVRPHPKFPDPILSAHENIVIDSPRKPMFDSLAECGTVMGVNSTTLLESALLGKTVLSFGESLATGTGLLFDVRPGDPMPDPGSVRIRQDTAAAVLFALLKKQMPRQHLDRPLEVMQSAVFDDMRRSTLAKPLMHDQ